MTSNSKYPCLFQPRTSTCFKSVHQFTSNNKIQAVVDSKRIKGFIESQDIHRILSESTRLITQSCLIPQSTFSNLSVDPKCKFLTKEEQYRLVCQLYEESSSPKIHEASYLCMSIEKLCCLQKSKCHHKSISSMGKFIIQ